MFGKILDFRRKDESIDVQFEQGTVKITAVTEHIIRVFSALENESEVSKAVTKKTEDEVKITVARGNESVIIRTAKIQVLVHNDCKIDFYKADGTVLCRDYREERKPQKVLSQTAIEQMKKEGHNVSLEEENYAIQVVKEMPEESCFYGLGDRTGFLNKRGYSYLLWNTDDPRPHVDSFKTLYKCIPFVMTRHNQGVYGIFFDQTYASVWDFGKENTDYYYFASKRGNLDYYFIAGEDLPQVCANYHLLTGTAQLPQLWTLGYHQSRWGYESETDMREVAANMRKNRIPCDVIHFDIEYMDHYKVFTWNPDTYDNPKKLIRDLSEDGFKIVTIIDPGVKVEKGYDIYEAGIENDYFVKTAEGENYVNEVWPGDSVYPDFGRKSVRSWWSKNHRFLIDMGVRGIWNDMNEPASFRGEIPDDIVFHDEEEEATHEKMHNVYGHLMSEATYEGMKEFDHRRPFVITRACYAGTQKYACGWTGDNHSIWAHLQMAVPQLCNLGLSGMSFAGTDIGGFGSDTTPELMARWIQVGCFSPLFRNHSSKGWRYQEPWVFGKRILDIYRTYVELRYQLLPYYYDLFEEMPRTGLPIMRPLVLHYEEDENVRELNDEFLIGTNILVAPIVNQGARRRMVYLPKGSWYDYHTGERLEGNTYFMREAPLELCPIYVKAGTILPKYPVQQYVGEQEINTLILELYPKDGGCTYEHYQDDGESFAYEKGEFNRYQFILGADGAFSWHMLHEEYAKKYQSLELHYCEKERKDRIKIIKL